METMRPEKKCDLVMKGGVTSGVVYPRAIVELSKEYQFSSIGGTSAGAIAAAVTAAAEYARAGGNQHAFEKIAELPSWLGEVSSDRRHSNLFHLFQPQRPLRELYGLAISGLGKSGSHKWLAISWAALRHFPIAVLVGAGFGIITVSVVWGVSPVWLRGLGFALVLANVAVGFVVGLFLVAGAQVAAIPKAKWGVCSGMTEKGTGSSPALVPWLTEYLDTLADKRQGEPLTFGDLDSRGIHLRTITTNLTTGRPYTMPFGEHTHFYFRGTELRNFFPEHVVSWMEKNPGSRSSRDQRGGVDSTGLNVLPDGKDLPVVVAVRMSLSFPFLFCPIPFYGVDFAFGPKTPDGKQTIPEPSFFVDGGLANNFPLNLFDEPLPRWPTFGINLRDKNDGRHNQDIYIPCKNSGGLEEWWTRFDEKRGLAGLVSFFGLLFDTSRNWRDNLQMNVPGYRDRVVHIGLDPAKEGGMNLDMTEDTICMLTERGENAGGAILSRYSPTEKYPKDPECPIGLQNQKWIRFRSLMELLENALLSMNDAVGYSGFREPTYDALLQQASDLSYPMPYSQQEYAIRLLDSLMQLVPEIIKKREMGQSFATKAPRPEPDLRVTPHF